jgi:hypothetical protein
MTHCASCNEGGLVKARSIPTCTRAYSQSSETHPFLVFITDASGRVILRSYVCDLLRAYYTAPLGYPQGCYSRDLAASVNRVDGRCVYMLPGEVLQLMVKR